MIRETILTTTAVDGAVQIAPIGLIQEGERWIIAPFRPSTTLENLQANPHAVANYTDDVLVFAGCLTGRRDWPTCPATKIPGVRLAHTLAHAELAVAKFRDDPVRPRFVCRIVHAENHAPFKGFNRAQAAVIEAAILVSRLGMLPWSKVESEVEYLKIAVSKTAGPNEQKAWEWLMAKMEEHRCRLSREAGE